MKTCFKCKEAKPLTEFYRHAAMGDGQLGKCKACTRKDVADRVVLKSKDPSWAINELSRQRAKSAKARAEGRAKPDPFRVRTSARKWSQSNPHKKAAHGAVANALRAGTLIRKPCEKCNAVNSQAHHDDYSKPLDVMWLCPKHHGERHVFLNEQKLIQKLTNSK